MRAIRAAVAVLMCLALPLAAQQEKAKALVKEAIAFSKKNGKDALVKETNQAAGRFHVQSGDELYIFIYDLQGLCIGMGYQSAAIGTNRWNIKDPDGKMILQEFVATVKAKGSGWVEYKFPNPKTNKIEQKTTYVEGLDGWVLGCGIYK